MSCQSQQLGEVGRGSEVHLVAMGWLVPNKGFDLLLRAGDRFREAGAHQRMGVEGLQLPWIGPLFTASRIPRDSVERYAVMLLKVRLSLASKVAVPERPQTSEVLRTAAVPPLTNPE